MQLGQRRSLVVGTFHYPPFITKNGVDGYSGIEVKILKTVASLLDHDLIFTNPSDGGLWGEVFLNGTAHGLVKDILEARVDVGIAQMFNKPVKNKFIQPSYPYDLDGYCWLVKNPKPALKLWAFGGPFGAWSWALIALSLLITTMYFFMTAKKSISWAGLISLGTALSQSVKFSPTCR